MESTWVPDELREVAEQVKQGKRPAVSVRTLLSWFGSRRRGHWVVRMIRNALTATALETQPDFNWIGLDGPVEFVAAKTQAPEPRSEQTAPTGEPTTISNHAVDGLIALDAASIDPTFRIGRLELANRQPVSVTPDSEVSRAVTVMLMNNFSPLPVMSGERHVKGLFSWRSLGSRLSQGHDCTLVRQAMDECDVLDIDASLFDAVDRLKTHDCVLIRDSEAKICGIMTAFDISVTFGQLGEPFLVLGEIENHIRGLIAGRFTKEQLAAVRDLADSARPVENVSDLTFGEYVRLLENPQNWQRLGVNIDRATFVKELEEIRIIRNDVMHFDPEGIEERDLKKLRDFVGFLQRLQKLKVHLE